MSDKAKDDQTRADMRQLTESYLKGKSKEDPTITEAEKRQFAEFMQQVTDAVLKQPKGK